MRKLIVGFWQGLYGDRRGSVLAYTAIALPVLIGFAGISIDIAYWYAKVRHLQSVADSAAVSGALENLRSDGSQTAIQAAAEADAANYSFAKTNERDIVVYHPPAISVTYAGFADMVEVVVSEPGSSVIAQSLFGINPTFTARAVAKSDTNNTCIWSLNPSATAAVSVQGAAQVSLGCGVLVNSDDPYAISQGGSSCLNSTEVKVVGGSSGSCINPAPDTGVSPVIDPLAAFDFETLYTEAYGSLPSCSIQNNTITTGNKTLLPGCYKKDFKINTSGTVTFQPGVYILDGAALEISAQSIVNGDGVVFYLTNSTGGLSGDVKINGGASVQFNAPNTDPFAGMLFIQDRDLPAGTPYKLNGGSGQDLEGIIYLPNQHLEYASGATLNSASSLIIADTVTFTGNTDIGVFENTPVLSNPLLFTSYLVE